MARDLVEVVATLDHSRDLVWTVVSDLGSYPRYVSEVSWCEPNSPGPPRAGSHYEVRFSIDEGPVRRNDVEVSVYRPNEYLVLASRQWPGAHVLVRLTPLGPRRTELRVTVAPPRSQVFTTSAVRWLRKCVRRALQLIDDHLSGVPVTTSSPHDRAHHLPKGQQRVSVRKVLVRAGTLPPRQPLTLLKQAYALARRDATIVGSYRTSAAVRPHDEAISDDTCTLTFADVDRRTNRLAHALTRYGVREGGYVVLWCHNHAALLESVIACGKLGAHALILSTDLPAAQATDALRHYRPTVVLVDDELAPPAGGDTAVIRIRTSGTSTLEELLRRGADRPVRTPSTKGRVTVLASGRSHGPKGGHRRDPNALHTVAAVLARIPLRTGERTLVAAPLFHSWAGLAAMQLGMPLAPARSRFPCPGLG